LIHIFATFITLIRETDQPGNLQNDTKIPVDNNPETKPVTKSPAAGSEAEAGFSLLQLAVKRALDIIISTLTLAITAPLSIAIAIIIKLSDGGSVLFRQERAGFDGKPFTLLKFRTMVPGAEPNGPMLSGPDDPRVTPVGKFMRHHKIDEIPNFINVLKGEMSIVGPRPERPFYIEKLRERSREIDTLFTVKPGITCHGQVLYGYASDIDAMTERLTHELRYIKKPSLLTDFRIMGQTTMLLVRGRKNCPKASSSS
jgi:lipopolysaccharide/colanic/teichoic acid biosynthesis glycosyltransferase